MRYAGIFCAILITLAAFVGCKKDLHDDDKPVAEIVSPTGGTFTGNIPFQLNFSDNKNLFQYRLAISYAGFYDTNDSAIAKPFTYVWVGDLASSSGTKQITIPLGDSLLNGQYRAVLTCVDEAGLESKPDTVLFTLKNLADTIVPVISLQNPVNGNSYSDSLNVLAVISDNTYVIYYLAEVRDSANVLKKEAFKYFKETAFAVDTVLQFNDLASGHYNFTLTVRDAYYNTNTTTIPITINP